MTALWPLIRLTYFYHRQDIFNYIKHILPPLYIPVPLKYRYFNFVLVYIGLRFYIIFSIVLLLFRDFDPFFIVHVVVYKVGPASTLKANFQPSFLSGFEVIPPPDKQTELFSNSVLILPTYSTRKLNNSDLANYFKV